MNMHQGMGSLFESLRATFPERPVPSVQTAFDLDEQDSAGYGAVLGGRPWPSVDPLDPSWLTGALVFMRPVGVAYYLPAWLSAMWTPGKGEWDAADVVAYVLLPEIDRQAKHDLGVSRRDQEQLETIVRLLSPAQLRVVAEAIRAWLLFAEEEDSLFSGSTFERMEFAFERYWRRFSDDR